MNPYQPTGKKRQRLITAWLGVSNNADERRVATGKVMVDHEIWGHPYFQTHPHRTIQDDTLSGNEHFKAREVMRTSIALDLRFKSYNLLYVQSILGRYVSNITRSYHYYSLVIKNSLVIT